MQQFANALADDKNDSKRPLNQVALFSLLLSIAAWPLTVTSIKTDGYDYLALITAIFAAILGHIAQGSKDTSRDNRLSVRALIISYTLIGTSLAWAVIKYWH